jgi:hypothetical protein
MLVAFAHLLCDSINGGPANAPRGSVPLARIESSVAQQLLEERDSESVARTENADVLSVSCDVA